MVKTRRDEARRHCTTSDIDYEIPAKHTEIHDLCNIISSKNIDFATYS